VSSPRRGGERRGNYREDGEPQNESEPFHGHASGGERSKPGATAGRLPAAAKSKAPRKMCDPGARDDTFP